MILTILLTLYVLVYGYFYEGAIELFKTKMSLLEKVFALLLYPFGILLFIVSTKL